MGFGFGEVLDGEASGFALSLFGGSGGRVGRKAKAADGDGGGEGGVVRWPFLSGGIFRWTPPVSVAELLKSCLVHCLSYASTKMFGFRNLKRRVKKNACQVETVE